MDSDRIKQRIGANIRKQRIFKGYSQEQLGNGLNITFQQVQKYENATNHVTAVRLYEIAQTLEVPVSIFYENDVVSAEEKGHASNREMLQLIQDFKAIKCRDTRIRVAALARVLAEGKNE